MLSMLPSSLVCTSVECVEKRAVEVLTRADEDSEVYRQLILALNIFEKQAVFYSKSS
jgi:hypothetical protein